MQESTFRRGDAVTFRYGVRTVSGVVREDRGPIGRNGRRLFLVEFLPDSHAEEMFRIELPAEQLERVSKPTETN